MKRLLHHKLVKLLFERNIARKSLEVRERWHHWVSIAASPTLTTVCPFFPRLQLSTMFEILDIEARSALRLSVDYPYELQRRQFYYGRGLNRVDDRLDPADTPQRPRGTKLRDEVRRRGRRGPSRLFVSLFTPLAFSPKIHVAPPLFTVCTGTSWTLDTNIFPLKMHKRANLSQGFRLPWIPVGPTPFARSSFTEASWVCAVSEQGSFRLVAVLRPAVSP